MTDEDFDKIIEEYEQALANMQREYDKRGDRIEELEKERDTYFAERNKFQLYLQRTHADWEIEVAAVDGLNAKLATASYNATAFSHRIVELEVKLERISEEWASALYGDLDHGVKSLSEAAHLDFHRRYPSIASFGSTLLDIMLEDDT